MIYFLQKIMNKNDKIFVLPIKIYPESPIINEIKDYRLHRLIHFSDSFFSNGGIKGNGNTLWQLQALNDKNFLQLISSLGYTHLLLNKKDSNFYNYNFKNSKDLELLFSNNNYYFFYYKISNSNYKNNKVFASYDFFKLRNDLLITNFNEKSEIVLSNKSHKQMKIKINKRNIIIYPFENKKLLINFGVTRINFLHDNNLFELLGKLMQPKSDINIQLSINNMPITILNNNNSKIILNLKIIIIDVPLKKPFHL